MISLSSLPATPPIGGKREHSAILLFKNCSSGTPWDPQGASTCMIYSCYDLACTMVLAVYIAKLISFLTVKNVAVPFTRLDELIDSEYKIGVDGSGLGGALLLYEVRL